MGTHPIFESDFDCLTEHFVTELKKMSGKKLSFAENFALSGCAAIVSKTAAAPIERVKLLIQNQDEMIKQGKLDRAYSGVIDCTKRTLSDEGLISFWRGNLANCIRYFPTQALNFAFKDSIKAAFAVPKDASYEKKLAANVASGGAAGTLSLTVVYSLDFCRTKLAAGSKGKGGERQYKGLLDVYKQTIATDGVAGLYRGFAISAVGIFIYRGLYFGMYDTLKPMFLGPDSGFLASFLLGWMVTVAASSASSPIDTIRRRMMMTSGTGVHYKSAFDAGGQILKNEGIMSFFKGNGANILRGVAGAGVLSGFDFVKAFYIKQVHG